MIVNDMRKSRNVGVPPQPQPLWIQIKQFCVVGIVFVSLNSAISLREEVGFNSSSNTTDTHYFNIEKVLKTWSM